MEDDVSTNKVGLGLLYHYKWPNCRKELVKDFINGLVFKEAKEEELVGQRKQKDAEVDVGGKRSSP